MSGTMTKTACEISGYAVFDYFPNIREMIYLEKTGGCLVFSRVLKRKPSLFFSSSSQKYNPSP